MTPSKNISIDYDYEHCKSILSDSDNYYEILDLSRNATLGQIISQYHKKCILVHPDRNKCDNAMAATKKLNQIKDTLTDYGKRIKYNQTLSRHNYYFTKYKSDHTYTRSTYSFYDVYSEAQTDINITKNLLKQKYSFPNDRDLFMHVLNRL